MFSFYASKLGRDTILFWGGFSLSFFYFRATSKFRAALSPWINGGSLLFSSNIQIIILFKNKQIANLNKFYQALSFLMASFYLSASAFLNLISLLAPLLNPPTSFSKSLFSLKWVLKAAAKLLSSPSSSFLTSVKATTAAFFWWTNFPRAAFPLTKQ